MAEVEPAIAHVLCPWDDCEEVIDIAIHVEVKFLSDGAGNHQAIVSGIDGPDVQPVWDHVLTAHGPRLD